MKGGLNKKMVEQIVNQKLQESNFITRRTFEAKVAELLNAISLSESNLN